MRDRENTVKNSKIQRDRERQREIGIIYIYVYIFKLPCQATHLYQWMFLYCHSARLYLIVLYFLRLLPREFVAPLYPKVFFVLLYCFSMFMSKAINGVAAVSFRSYLQRGGDCITVDFTFCGTNLEFAAETCLCAALS